MSDAPANAIGVYEALSEEECYLWAIISDPSGLDTAEFLLADEHNDDGCFRAWAFQWPWWRCEDKYQIDLAARSMGKSRSIQLKCLAFGIVHPGQEMVVTAPEAIHLNAVLENVETIFRTNRFASQLLESGRIQGVRRKPWHFAFKNGSQIKGLIPHRKGDGVKGSHPLWLEQDEASDFNDAGWTELNSTLQDGQRDAQWRAHGVTRGVRDKFYEHTRPESQWTVHNLPALYRPTLTPEIIEEEVQKYGSKEDPDFRRNFYGMPGDNQSPLFILHNLMRVVDDNESSDYNEEEYHHFHITDPKLRDARGNIEEMLELPPLHKSYKHFWAGMDVGFINDPSIILVFAESDETVTIDKTKTKKMPVLRLLLKVTMKGVSAPDQERAMAHIIDFYRPHAFSMDATGAGLPLYQFLQRRVEENPDMQYMIDRIRDYNFSAKIIAGFDETIEYDKKDPEGFMETAIWRNVKDWSTDALRLQIDEQKIVLPWDRDLIGEFQSQTFSYGNQSHTDAYGKRRSYSGGNDHTLDSARMAILGYSQRVVEQIIQSQKKPAHIPAEDIFVYGEENIW